VNHPIQPSYLGDDSLRWIEALLSKAESLSDNSYSIWESELNCWAVGEGSSGINQAKLRVAVDALLAMAREKLRETRSRKLMIEVKRRRQDYYLNSSSKVAEVLPVAVLFGDLLSQHLVPASLLEFSPMDIAKRANWMIVSRLLYNCKSIKVRALGGTRKFIHGARVRGLITTIKCYDQLTSRLHMEISGPLSIFHRTPVYARALQQLVIGLGKMLDFELHISMGEDLGNKIHLIRPHDPIQWPPIEVSFDSKLERKFERDFTKAGSDWELVREPAAIQVGTELFFPDFALRNRLEPGKTWLIEIVGFWHPEYLKTKFRKLREAGNPMIVAIDESLKIPAAEIANIPNRVMFRKNLKPIEVLRALQQTEATPRT
jgi:predicted nuclease of restriction endonuclease-like RecB superfamily